MKDRWYNSSQLTVVTFKEVCLKLRLKQIIRCAVFRSDGRLFHYWGQAWGNWGYQVSVQTRLEEIEDINYMYADQVWGYQESVQAKLGGIEDIQVSMEARFEEIEDIKYRKYMQARLEEIEDI